MGRKLDQVYYKRGPKTKLKTKLTSAKWRAIGPLIDPCVNKNNPITLANQFDPIAAEIEALEGLRTVQLARDFACDTTSDADDEAEQMKLIIPGQPLLKQFESVSSSEADASSCDTLSLPWYDLGSSSMQPSSYRNFKMDQISDGQSMQGIWNSFFGV